MSTDRSTATRRADHLLDDILNVTGRFSDDPKTGAQGLRRILAALIHSDTAGGSLGGTPLSGTSYDGDGIRGSDPTDPTGDRAARNLDDQGERDEVHDLRTAVEGYLRDAAHSLYAADNALQAFMQLRNEDPNPIPVRYCPCARYRETNKPPVHHGANGGVDVGGRLTERVGLCRDCYEAVIRTAESGTGNGRLPNADEIRHHDRNGRWRIVTGAAA